MSGDWGEADLARSALITSVAALAQWIAPPVVTPRRPGAISRGPRPWPVAHRGAMVGRPRAAVPRWRNTALTSGRRSNPADALASPSSRCTKDCARNIRRCLKGSPCIVPTSRSRNWCHLIWHHRHTKARLQRAQALRRARLRQSRWKSAWACACKPPCGTKQRAL